ncbi:class I SAM-dependent methyltransferase [Mycoplasmatota bacterium]|nr:class I SAM-dependent methyltransferase [Mycoplasmatota bacterium]
MTNHYYNNNLDTKSEERTLEFQLLTERLKFITDNGVFSKKTIDYGTRVLVKGCTMESWYKNVLDIGCGYGPIGISLAKEFSDIHFDLIDINLRAINLARRNAKLNNLKNISIFESNIFKMINTSYDCILTNPPIRAGKRVVHQILEESIDYLNNKGSIYIIIQKKQGAASAMDKLNQIYGNCEIICRDKGYYLLKSVKK